MGPRIRRALGLAGEAVPVLVIALVVFVLIRNHLAEYYRIPSRSMAPLLNGDPEHGDLVFVDKTAWWWGRLPDPFDVVVVKNRAGRHGEGVHSEHMVKRLVALGPANVTIQEGDLFLGSAEGDAGKRVVKDPVRHRDLRIPVFEHGTGRRCEVGFADFFQVPVDTMGRSLAREEGAGIRFLPGAPTPGGLQPQLLPDQRARQVLSGSLDGHLPGHMTTRQAVDTSFLDADGRRQGEGKGWREGWQPDIGLELALVPQGPVTGLQLVLEHYGHTVAMSCGAGGTAQLLVRGVVSGGAFTGPRLVPGATVRVSFGYLDGHIFGVVDDRLVLHRPLHLDRDPNNPRENSLHLALSGGSGSSVLIQQLVVFHDLIYAEDDRRIARLGANLPYSLDRGQMFLLGDNTRDSLDSRDLAADPFVIEDLVGRPVAILAPSGRRRVLPR